MNDTSELVVINSTSELVVIPPTRILNNIVCE